MQEDIEADNASLGTVISSQMIDDLPLSGRDVTNVLKLQAGATTLKGGSQLYWTQHGFNTEYQGTSIDGARSESIASARRPASLLSLPQSAGGVTPEKPVCVRVSVAN